MRGFIGFSLTAAMTAADLAHGRAAIQRIVHRGPDGGGEWQDEVRGVYLGHRRRSILDTTESSSQPMKIGPFTNAYKGELYNFTEVRAKLQAAGLPFETTSDTEVVLKAWQHWSGAALMCSIVRPKHTAGLSGLGGDKLFFGYNKYVYCYQHRRAFHAGARLRPLRSRIPGALARIGRVELLRRNYLGEPAHQFLAIKSTGLVDPLESRPGASRFEESFLSLTSRNDGH